MPKPWRNVCEMCQQPAETIALFERQYLCPSCVVSSRTAQDAPRTEEAAPAVEEVDYA